MYPELALFEPTSEQDKALSIQRKEDSGAIVKTNTNGEYAVLQLSLILDSYVARHIVNPTVTKVDPAYIKAPANIRAQVDQLLNIDTTIPDADSK